METKVESVEAAGVALPRKPLDQFEVVIWRGTTGINLEQQCLGLSFDRADGSVLRLKLDLESARDVGETLLQSLQRYGVRTQSARSSEMPSVDGSVMPGQF